MTTERTMLLWTAHDDVLNDASVTVLCTQSSHVCVHPAYNRRTRVIIIIIVSDEFHVDCQAGRGQQRPGESVAVVEAVVQRQWMIGVANCPRGVRVRVHHPASLATLQTNSNVH